MRQTNRQTYVRETDVRRQTNASLNASALWGRRHNNNIFFVAALQRCFTPRVLAGVRLRGLSIC